MEQSETVTDLAPKKLARQKLDFTVVCRASTNVPTQPQLQSHFQLQPPPPPPPPHSQHPQIQVRPVVQRIPHPVVKLPLPPMPQPKQQSPGSRLKCNFEGQDGTPKKPKQCNCRNSRCLKLYCECFAAGIHCNGCNCTNCYNNVENEAVRQEAVEATLERNPNAFRPKIGSSPHGSRDAREDTREAQTVGRHNKGCNCKKSGCLKKYCECFQASIFCSENCKCMDCKNFEGSEERKALFRGAPSNMAYIQQAANAAIIGAVGSSGFGTPLACKKRKIEEVLDMENRLRTAASSCPSSIPVSRAANAAALGSPKFSYRSPLTGILQPQDVREICSVFVVLSRETAKAIGGKRREVDQQPERENIETANSSNQQKQGSPKGNDVQKAMPDDHLNGVLAERNQCRDSESDGHEMENGRPGSPEIDLMCHEQELMFTKVGSPNGLTKVFKNKTLRPPSRDEYSEFYAEQERLILTGLRDCLNRLITCASIKETMCSPLTKSKTCNQEETAARGTIESRIETGNPKNYYGNSPAIAPVTATSISLTDLPTKSPSLVQQEPVEQGSIKPGIERANSNGYSNGIVQSPIVVFSASNGDLPVKHHVTPVANGGINSESSSCNYGAR